jgi:trk system potassium uptake protein TrkH
MILGRAGLALFADADESGRPHHALSAAQLFVLSFLGMIAIGTAGLLWLPGLYAGPGLGFVDALFTATSAVCVTGLIVVDTATYFTPAGQAWILMLLQAGGLGILTFGTFILALLGGRHLEMEEAAGGHAAFLRYVSLRGLLRTVMALTFTVEAIGAVALWIGWRGRFGPGEALWHAVFHSVSAFCNAGFSTFSDSLVGVRTSPLTVGTVSALVVLGGLGFIVVEDLRARWLGRTARRLSVHARLVLTSTGILLGVGLLLFLLLESRTGGVLIGLPWPHRLLNAFFMAVTPRTAGFNTVDYDALTNPGLMLTVVLMGIGGSPGSTAGGMKTVSVSLLVLLLWSRLRGRRHVAAFDRTIPWETIHRAIGLVIGGGAVLVVGTFLLMTTESLTHGAGERAGLARLLFESTSAFSTVGLSMGSTPRLSVPGRLVVAVLMFVGRVGPAAVLAAMFTARRAKRSEVRFAHEDVILG